MRVFLSAVALILSSVASPAHPCDTTWRYTDATQRVVSCISNNGTNESGLATNPAVAAWVAQGNTIAAPPAAPIITIQVASTGFPALNGTYGIDPGSLQTMQAIAVYVLTNGHFPNGAALQQWKDTSGTVHSFPNGTEWQAFVTAVTDFVLKVQQGQSPVQPTTIP